jgi:hypothetical protein
MKTIAFAAVAAAMIAAPVMANDRPVKTDDLAIVSTQGAPLGLGAVGGASVVALGTVALAAVLTAGSSSGTSTRN